MDHLSSIVEDNAKPALRELIQLIERKAGSAKENSQDIGSLGIRHFQEATLFLDLTLAEVRHLS